MARPRWAWVGCLTLLCLVKNVAEAAEVRVELGLAEDRIAPIVGTASRLSEGAQDTGRDYIGVDEAVARYQRHTVDFFLGDYSEAAEGFFALVTTDALADAGLAYDAEWYLSESLFEMGNYRTAESRYLSIIQEADNPFRADAVRRLLNIYSATGDFERFDRHYEREVLRGRVQSSPSILYAVAKNHFEKGDIRTAEEHFLQFPPGDVWYAKAQYWVGTIQVIRGDLEKALPYFQAASSISIDSAESTQIVDLAHLAQGRVYFESEDYLNAVESYNRVSARSEFLSDKLNELVWTSIRLEHEAEALDAIDIFLLAFPEHEYSAKLKLLQGQLSVQLAAQRDGFLREDAYAAALGSFESVVADYRPVQKRFNALASSGVDPREYFRQVVYLESGEDALPGFAVAMMRSDPDLSRAISAFMELERQRQDLEVSERLVGELSTLVAEGESLSSFEQLRLDTTKLRGAAIAEQLSLLEIEAEWLQSEGISAIATLEPRRLAIVARVTGLEQEFARASVALGEHERDVTETQSLVDEARVAVQQQLEDLQTLRKSLDSGSVVDTTRQQVVNELGRLADDMTEAEQELGRAETRLALLRAPGAAPSVRIEGELPEEIDRLAQDYVAIRGSVSPRDQLTIDRLHASLAAVHQKMDVLDASLAGIRASSSARIRARFENEVQEVASQRAALKASLLRAEGVSGTLTREGFARLAEFFADSVLRADSGIVDVYWAQKLETADELVRVKEERHELLEELERRFSLIHQKLGE